jgi:transposase
MEFRVISKLPTDNEVIRILQWSGYQVYRQAIGEKNTLDLWVRRKRGKRKLECSGCGRKFTDAHDCSERTVRDLPWKEFRSTVHIEIYRVKCPDCGVKVEKVPLPSGKTPFSKRFEDVVAQARENASARQVAWRFGLVESTVRNYCGITGMRERWSTICASGSTKLRWRRLPSFRKLADMLTGAAIRTCAIFC